jgi:hypothetical protein
VPKRTNLVSNGATLVPEVILVPKRAILGFDSATLIFDDATLVPKRANSVSNDTTLISDGVTLVPKEQIWCLMTQL